MQYQLQKKTSSMTDSEFREAYYKLSNAQRRYIFDRKYISTNPKTKEVLIRKGYVIPYDKREKQYSIAGILNYTTQFTEKCHDMVKYYCDKRRIQQKVDYPDFIPIDNDDDLLSIFSEILLCNDISECCIYQYRSLDATISTVSHQYILHPYYKWKIDIDKTSGRFLNCAYSSIGNKNSYMYKGKQI
jgi:hypothetical protein